MAEPLLHPSTEAAVNQLLAHPTHAICLIGPPGSGKHFLARYIAGELLGELRAESLLEVGTSGEIGIKDVRELQHFLQLRQPGRRQWRRAIIICEADNMGIEAQNALLKTLEEPPADAVFILTTSRPAKLRSTIHSRVQSINVLPLSLEQALAAFASQANRETITKAYHLSGGYAGLLSALIGDSQHPLSQAINEAKQLLQAPVFERLAAVDKLAKQKDQLPDLLYALRRLVSALLSGPAANADNRTEKLVRSARAIYQAEADLQLNANAKLVLTDLFLQL